MKVAPSDVCFPAQMQREGAALEINQPSVMLLRGRGSLCAKLGASIVPGPARPPVAAHGHGGLELPVVPRGALRLSGEPRGALGLAKAGKEVAGAE